MRLYRSLLSLLPWVLGAASLGITGWLWRHEQVSMHRLLKADFDFSVRQTASRVQSRMANYEQMLRGVQGLFASSGPVRADQFAAYVDALLAGADFNGIQYFAYAPKLPDGAGSAVSARVVHVAPGTALNLEIVGDDPYADPVRRPAMQWAADSGGLGVTPRLADPGGADSAAQQGFLMFLPIYAKALPVDTAASRRAALAGWVFARVRMNDLMSSLYGEGTPGIELRIHDGLALSAPTLMYASGPDRGVSPRPVVFEALEYIGHAGHNWTLAVIARPEFAQRFGGDAAPVIAWSGLGFSLLLVLLTRQLVSARHMANDAATAMTSELRASEERYRRIVETADEGIWMSDSQARTTFVNPKLARMLGYAIDELLGRTPIALLDEAQHPDLTHASAAGMSDAQPRELRLRRKDGSALWASLTTTPIVDAAGRPDGTLSMVTDITARRRADAARVELEAQLRESQKMEAVGTLAGGIAHDFNNVLAAILGNVAMALEQVAPEGAISDHLRQIGKAEARARSLVEQILAFSRKQPHRLVVLPLRPVIAEAVRLLRPVLPALAELEVTLGDAPLNVMADATQLQQVVMNLCTNAWHALNGRTGRITVGLDAASVDAEAARRLGLSAGDYAHLWVGDTGCGMDEATRARVFEPFFTTKPVGQGTGLGLSVVHGIVATHGGAITVTSAPGQGSRFDILLPRIARPAALAPLEAEPSEPSPGVGRHVVYVDDDPVMVAMVEALLQRAGYRVTSFEDPRAAIAALQARVDAIDIVVTDYNMPVLSGLDVAAELARLRPGLPVVISSGYVTEELIAAATRLGVREVLQKEYTFERLPGLVRALVAGQGVVRSRS